MSTNKFIPEQNSIVETTINNFGYGKIYLVKHINSAGFSKYKATIAKFDAFDINSGTYYIKVNFDGLIYTSYPPALEILINGTKRFSTYITNIERFKPGHFNNGFLLEVLNKEPKINVEVNIVPVASKFTVNNYIKNIIIELISL